METPYENQVSAVGTQTQQNFSPVETTDPKKEVKKSETDAHRTQNLQVQFEDCFPKLEEAEDSQVGGL